MDDRKTKDAGALQALIDRLDRQRLPRLLSLLRKVDGGELLGEMDLQFLNTVQKDAGEVRRLADRNPQIQPLVAKVVGLYDEIIRKALANQQKASKQKL